MSDEPWLDAPNGDGLYHTYFERGFLITPWSGIVLILGPWAYVTEDYGSQVRKPADEFVNNGWKLKRISPPLPPGWKK